jgi:hypothetical protein
VSGNDELTIRPLRRGDLETIFQPDGRWHGEERLERQGRGEVYVAVAERGSA